MQRLLRMHRALCRRRKWLAGNFIANLFPIWIIKIASLARTWMKSRLDFPENATSRSPVQPFLPSLIFRRHSQRHTLYENVTFSYPTRALAHTVPLCNGPWTNIGQQLVDGLPRPAIKRHESLQNSQDLRFFRMFFHYSLLHKSSTITDDIAVDRVFFAVWF